jgi:DNA invertase Pin-like site-specific DNA recombinase
MKIAILSRVSTTKQDNENQLLQLREFAGKQGWEIVGEYIDTVTGSGKKARDQFDRMMRDASQRKFDLVLFWKLDRFSREGVRKTLRHNTRT